MDSFVPVIEERNKGFDVEEGGAVKHISARKFDAGRADPADLHNGDSDRVRPAVVADSKDPPFPGRVQERMLAQPESARSVKDVNKYDMGKSFKIRKAFRIRRENLCSALRCGESRLYRRAGVHCERAVDHPD
jgi:hypothetical protein